MQDIKLTPHQKQMLTEAKRLLQTNNTLVIKGKAGVGKTTLVKFLLPSLIENDSIYERIYITAPTNKAVSVLRNMGIRNNKNIIYRTIHSCLKLKRRIQPNGEIVFKAVDFPEYLKKTGAIVIDECSMISLELLEEIIRMQIEFPQIKVIYLGDPGQINPVNEFDTPVFNQNYPAIELTEIIRQAENNPIITLSRNINFIKRKIPHRDGKIGYIYTNNIVDVISTLAHANGSDDLKYLAWTNKNVDTVNRLVRESIYTNPHKLEVDETIIFNAPYRDMYTNGEQTVVKPGMIIKVDRFKIQSSLDLNKPPFFVNLKYYEFNNGVKLIHEDSEETFRNTLGTIIRLVHQEEYDWIDYYDFKDTFADINYAHAITVHKSQGSTYRQVIINYRDIMSNKNKVERERLLYTAITRASELVIFFNI